MMDDIFESPILCEDMEQIFSSQDFSALRGKSILISGSTGMIASYLIYFFIYLNEFKDYHLQLYAMARRESKVFSRFGKYAKADYFHIYLQDVCEKIQNFIKADYILHAASLASPQYYGAYPVETMLPNLVGTYELLNLAKRCRAEKFIFFSSGAVYGKVSDGVIKEDTVGFLDHLAPGSVYAESKRCGEALCLAFQREHGVPVSIVRFGHTYGPTLDLATDKRAFSEFTLNILRGEDIVLKSDGKEKRAFCYLSDAACMLFQVMLSKNVGECYNIVNQNAFVSISELSQTLVSLFPQKGLKVVFEKREDRGYLPLSQTSSVVCSMEKVMSFGFSPRVGIREGFLRTVLHFESLQNKGLL